MVHMFLRILKQEFKNKYDLNGWVEVRVFVDNKEKKNRLTLNTTVEEIPFWTVIVIMGKNARTTINRFQ